jgi:hypothetical protein
MPVPAEPAKAAKAPEPVPVAAAEPPVAAVPDARCGPSTTGPLKPGGTVRFGKAPTTPGTTGIPGRIHPVPKIVHGQASATGGYDIPAMRRFLRRRNQDFSWCYEQELAQNSDLAGTVTLMFTIGGDGKVTQGCARGITSSLETCIDAATKKVQFPPPVDAKPVDVTYPLDFTGEWP